jgi:2-succinyl-6-hydroxy-2,4-cyclohexadiene-1-carboxylate synthase
MTPVPADIEMPRVVLVPGFAQTAAAWDGVREVLEPVAEVEVLEIPRRPTFAETARALAEGAGRACWVGYSMGGRLALRVALDWPGLVERLVVVSATPGLGDPAERAARVEADDALAARALTEGAGPFLDRWEAQPMFAGVPRDAPGRADRRRLDAETIAHQLRALGTGTMEPMWNRLPEVAMPVLLVTGDRDEKFDTINRLAFERIPEARHVRLRGGHALPQEHPGVLGSLIAAFVAE